MLGSFYSRAASGDCPAGWTVTRCESLPVGDFTITEYKWDTISLWFVDSDGFTADEREAMYERFCKEVDEYA